MTDERIRTKYLNEPRSAYKYSVQSFPNCCSARVLTSIDATAHRVKFAPPTLPFVPKAVKYSLAGHYFPATGAPKGNFTPNTAFLAMMLALTSKTIAFYAIADRTTHYPRRFGCLDFMSWLKLPENQELVDFYEESLARRGSHEGRCFGAMFLPTTKPEGIRITQDRWVESFLSDLDKYNEIDLNAKITDPLLDSLTEGW